jgi:Signal transduction histidine kinase
MNEVVRSTVRMLERVLGEDVRLAIDLPADLWPVRVDRASIEQALLNLAVNARDAMPRGGTLSIGTRNFAVDPAYAAAHAEIEPGAYVLLVVADDGHGMDPHVLERIFEPFFTTKEVGRGTGLGLASVYGTVKQAGGHVAVSSEPGRGTRFEILLPRHETAAEGVPEGVERARVEGGVESVLLVEDEPSVRAIAAESLRSAGYLVVEAPDGEEAVRVARESGGHFRLLVTDVVMPRRSGPETAEALRGSQPDLKVLYMSGYTDDALARAGKTGPGDGFLSKPFAPSALLAKVREMLDR